MEGATHFIEQYGYRSDPLDFEFSDPFNIRYLKNALQVTNEEGSNLKTTAYFIIKWKPGCKPNNV